ncbi:glycosyltransferase [Herbaspirillum rubrisubalbicans]|uniref:Glycosyltransferase n=1 Tax=Herbaspirillum rubrisubalbicans Os34 TaxID=1235827 RepID=A0A6M3ZLN5_9BURK|nr:glycosyltransferase [Herbaspirillum rubrisubalbicans]QJP99537.1 glycosyltransferase [Herbaspirillum rubrisubalbicans Os34]
MQALSRNAPLLILATTGTTGDMLPFLTLGLGLQARGHRVLMVVPRFHAALFESAGLSCHGLGSVEEFQAVLDNPDLWDERKGWQVMCQAARPHIECLHQLIAQLPAHEDCVVLSHPLLVPAADLARAVRPGLRIVATYLAPSNLCSSHDLLAMGSLRIPPWLPLPWRKSLWSLAHRWQIDPPSLPALNATRTRLGLPPVAHFFAHVLQAPDASLGLFPAWFGAVQSDWPQPFLCGQFPPPSAPSTSEWTAELRQFLDNGPEPIVFTPGSGHQHAAQFFDTAIQATQELGRRALLVTRHRAQLPAVLPQGVLWQQYVSFDALLPEVAAIVHHGGIGTTAAALRAGVPQLVVPFAYDQFDNGYRVQRLGVGEIAPAKSLTTAKMIKALIGLLEKEPVRVRCATLAQTMSVEESQLPTIVDCAEQALLNTRK